MGLEEFVQGGYFGGELYVDTKQASYKALGFRRMSWLQLVPALLAKVARDGYSKARGKGISGDTKGDGMQNGGLLVVGAEGPSVLLEHRQHNPADLVDNAEVARALGIDTTTTAATTTTTGTTPSGGLNQTMTCDLDVCSIKK